MPGVLHLYKIICVSCDWWITRNSDKCLWKELSFCPKCEGPTDAFEILHDEQIGAQ